MNCTTNSHFYNQLLKDKQVDNTVILMMLNRIILCCVLLPLIKAGPTLYKLDEEKNTAERVMIPVSSTGVCYG
jgi:hypothetical protein